MAVAADSAVVPPDTVADTMAVAAGTAVADASGAERVE
jgi:hypothetical protein